MLRKPLVRFAGLAPLLVGCETGEPVRLASAYPEIPLPIVFDVVRDAMDSARGRVHVEIEPWTVRGPDLALHSLQAEAFAANAQVKAIVGHAGSRDALLGALVYNREAVPHVVPTGTSSELRQAGPWTFMLAPNDSVEGAFIADWAVDSAHATRVVIMYLGDEYGIGIREGVRAGLAARGLALADEVLIPAQNCGTDPIPINRDVFRTITHAMLRRARPDAVVLAAADVNGWCLAGTIHAADSTLWVIAADGFNARNPVLSRTTPHNPARLRSVAFWTAGADSASRAFVERFRRVTGTEPDAGAAMIFDANMVLFDAIQQAGPDRHAIRRWLESLGTTRPPWPGATGPVYFDRPRAELLRMIAPAPAIVAATPARPE